jgi:hypothetical protein
VKRTKLLCGLAIAGACSAIALFAEERPQRSLWLKGGEARVSRQVLLRSSTMDVE